jgi:orotidine-5'-phosphate decarboxylase
MIESARSEIPARERLMLALDVADPTVARELVEELGDEVSFYKIGLQLFLSGGYFQLAEWLQKHEKKVFADLKLFDVPQTVSSAVLQLRGRHISFVTVHGNDAILEAACEVAEGDPGILAVTALTSLDEADMKALGFHTDIPSLVLSRARRAAEIGCAGVIASGREAALLREALGDALLIVVPGIRPGTNRTDDQKRTVDVEEAFEAGADYIVIGRPIRNAPRPAQAARDVQRRIANVFGC